MKHPDGTPYWEPTPMPQNAAASITYSMSTGEIFSIGGTYLGIASSLTACGEEFIGEVIRAEY